MNHDTRMFPKDNDHKYNNAIRTLIQKCQLRLGGLFLIGLASIGLQGLSMCVNVVTLSSCCVHIPSILTHY